MSLRWLLVLFMCTACNGYSYVLQNPVLNDVADRIDKEKHITKEYYPEWLASSDNMASWELSLKQGALWSWITPEAVQNYMIQQSLPASGIHSDDPELFEESELKSLNPHMPSRQKRPAAGNSGTSQCCF